MFQKPVLPETGLEGALFQVLDVEHHKSLIENVHDTLISLVQCLAAEQLTFWMGLCKEILASSAAGKIRFSYLFFVCCISIKFLVFF